MKKNFQQLQAEILHLEDRRYYFNWNPYILGEDERTDRKEIKVNDDRKTEEESNEQ